MPVVLAHMTNRETGEERAIVAPSILHEDKESCLEHPDAYYSTPQGKARHLIQCHTTATECFDGEAHDPQHFTYYRGPAGMRCAKCGRIV